MPRPAFIRSPAPNFNHPTTGTASTSYALATGLGTPKANLLISALVQLNTPTATHTTTTVSAAKGTVTVVGHANDMVAPTAPTTTGTTTTTTTTCNFDHRADSEHDVELGRRLCHGLHRAGCRRHRSCCTWGRAARRWSPR